MAIIQNPFEQWNDPLRGGRVIFSAKIYVGQPDTDPTVPANQLQVFYIDENEQQINLAQPLTTDSGGYIVISDTNPTKVQARVSESNYSITVQNKQSVNKWVIPNAQEISSVVSHNDTLNRNAIGAHDAIYSRTYDTYAAMRAETASLIASKYVRTRQHTSNGAGGATYVRTGATGTPNTGNEIEWHDSAGNKFVLDNIQSVDMYQLGGAFQGNCEAAFNLAMSDNRIIYVHCPDQTSYGDHNIDCQRKIVRGHGTQTFHVTPAGFHPRNVSDRLVVEGFDVTMAAFPRTGGDNANSQVFMTLATPNADIQDLVVRNNKTRNGRIGISTAVENARILRGQILIEQNHVFDPMGASSGQGYGVHVSNESPNGGEIIVRNNHVWRADRHSYYLALNTQDGTSIKFYCNTAHDHRENSETKGGGARAAIELSRCRNVVGWGNNVFGFYDSALTMTEEKGAIPNPAPDLNIRLVNTTITNPKNVSSAVNIGYLTKDNSALVDGVTLDGINYICDGTLTSGAMVEAVRFHYGRRATVRGLDCNYRNITSGTIRPVVLQGTNIAATNDIKVIDTIIKCTNCSNATLGVFRFLDACRDNNIPIKLDGLEIDSDTSSTTTIDSTGAIANDSVLIRGFELSGATITPRRIISYTTEDNRQIGGNGGTPIGNVTPLYQFEEILMTLNNTFWKSYGTTNQDWRQISN